MKNLIQKFKDGDHITNGELDLLIDHYTVLVQLLEHHGDVFKLVWRECYESLMRLEGYKKVRFSK